MKKSYILLILLLLIGVTTSCNYLDIVPDERPKEEDAFKDKYAADRYLYSCYAFMVPERQGVMMYQTGEIVCAYPRTFEFMQGSYTSANVGHVSPWSRMYGGIKRCHQLLENIDAVPRMEDATKLIYKAEAKFLIAFYHFCLLRAYGPVIIADKSYDINMPTSDYPKRSTFDESVKWIANLLDEAAVDLKPLHESTDYGRATKVAAKALKGRLLLYAASPLFNGNSEFYSQAPKDPETGELLMNLTYDANKWQLAYDACQEAITLAEATGHVLYKGVPTTDIPYPDNNAEFSLRMLCADKTNMEVIFADTRREGYYDFQNQATPRDPSIGDPSYNGVSPTLAVVQNFYTEKGLPIDQDPSYYPKDEYYETANYPLTSKPTAKLHLKREPRFYSWIAFHNCYYELQRDDKKRILIEIRSADVHGKGDFDANFSLGGYLVKKGVTPEFSTKNSYKHYPWPLIRLAELYLNLAEAAVEVNRLDVAKTYLDKVRERAGIPLVDVAWSGIATLDQAKLREIVRKERTIELFLEGQYGWDIRRWKVAHTILNKNPEGMNVNGATDSEFFQPTVIEKNWRFTSPTNYLLPIASKELNTNTKLAQNPGY